MCAPEPGSFEEILSIDDFTSQAHGFTRVDWHRYWDVLEKRAGDRQSSWEHAKLEWCEQLRADLGGASRLLTAPSVLLVTDMEPDFADGCLHFTDEVHGMLRLAFADLAHPHAFGRVPILIFSDDSDYYAYLSFHYPEEGTFPASAGIQIRDGCPHVAVHSPEGRSAANTIAHELSHLLLSHLPLPRWLDEGVAMKMPRALAGSSSRPVVAWWNAMEQTLPPLILDDTFDRLQSFWDEERIQSFWAGTSFDESGESCDLSYVLAELLVSNLSEDWASFIGFLAAAHYDDAGQTAALDHLGLCLGTAAANFLGEGFYRPVRKDLVRCWNERATK